MILARLGLACGGGVFCACDELLLNLKEVPQVERRRFWRGKVAMAEELFGASRRRESDGGDVTTIQSADVFLSFFDPSRG